MMAKSSRKKVNCGKCGRMNLPKMISEEVFIVLNRNASVGVPDRQGDTCWPWVSRQPLRISSGTFFSRTCLSAITQKWTRLRNRFNISV